MNNDSGQAIAGLTFLLMLVLWVVALVGYVWNIVKLIGILDDGITGWFIGRCLGILVPFIGAILGYF